MTQPYEIATVEEMQFTKRDPSEVLHIAACRNLLLIVRPLEYKPSGFKTSFVDDTDVVFADIAVLDPVPPWVDNDGNPVQPHQANTQFRNQVVLQGYLKGTFKNYIGKTCVGTIYTEPSGKGKPSIKFRDLSQHPVAVQRAQQFLATNPTFLIPVAGQFTNTAPAPPPDPWATSAVPASPNGYQTDPWAQTASAPVSAAPVSPAPAAPRQTTLDQLKNMGPVNGQGQPQSSDIPF